MSAGEDKPAPAAVTAKPDSPGVHPSELCPGCSLRLEARQCKLVCPACGYYMSCSDYY